MGSLPSRAVGQPTTLDSYVDELGPDITYDASLGHSRFLKTIKASHPRGPLIIKVFLKADPGMSLLVHRRRLKADREVLAQVHNVHSYQAMFETDRAAYLVRQYLANDLYDRISTRPFLAEIERKWLAYQLLVGMSEIRALKLSHGDLKPSNVLVTTFLSVRITDLSPFKPVYLPEDDPSDFSFFFAPNPSSRACYLAPERFYPAGSKAEQRRLDARLEEGKRDGKVTEEMDVFSAGCVLAEMWTEGRELFDLSGMLAFRKGESSPEAILQQILDEQVQAMLRSMVALDPSDRPSFARLLADYRGTVFPEVFYTFLHDYGISLSEVPAHAGGVGVATGQGDEDEKAKGGAADERVAKIWEDWESIQSYLDTEAGEGAEGLTEVDGAGRPISTDGPALVILDLLTPDLRSCTRPTSLLHALAVLEQLAGYLTDEAKLDRIVPFLGALLEHEAAGVRAGAVYHLAKLLETVQVVSPSNLALMTDFVLPHCRPLGSDDEVEVRVAYAQALASLAETGERFLELGESLRSIGGREDGGAGEVEEVSYEQSRAELEQILQGELSTLLSDPSPFVKRALLSDIATFAVFLGRSRTDDVLLSHMLTYLNDSDWALRCDFFESIVGVSALIGEQGLEALILPLFLQALSDPEEWVVVRVLTSMKALAEIGMFSRIRLWEVGAASLALLAHPNVWIRQTAVGLLAAVGKRLSFTDNWCILYPSIRPHLRSETSSLSEAALLEALLPPISRSVFDAALAWAVKSPSSPFWSAAINSVGKSKMNGIIGTIPRNARADVLSVLSDVSEPLKSEEDEKALAGLRQKGLPPRDEQRLLLMRAHMLKLSRRQQAFGPEATFADAPATLETVPLNSLGITPRNIFFNTQPSGPSVSSRRLKSRTASKASLLERRPSNFSEGRSSNEPPLGKLRPFVPALSDLPTPPQVASPSAPPSESALSMTHTPNPKSAAQVGVALTNASAFLESQSDRLLEENDADLISARSSPREAPYEGAPARMSRDRIQGYDGTDPSIIHFLEIAYVDSLKESAHDFGPRISPAAVSSRRKSSASRTTVPSRASANTAEASPFSFLGTTSPVVHLAASPDQIFFVTTHSDHSVRVWDSARLERNVSSKPRLVHHLGSNPTALCFIEDTHCFAIACTDGSVSILRAHISSPYSHPKFREVELVRFYQCVLPGDYAVALSSVSSSDGSMELVLATVRSLVLTIDLCSMRILRTLNLPLDHGPPSCVYADRGRQWLAIGTSQGVLFVWDARFSLPVRSWTASSSGRVRFCLRHPLKSRWVLVASESAGSSYLQSFEVETGRLMEDFTTSTGPSTSLAAAKGAPSQPLAEPRLASDSDIDRAMASMVADRAVKSATSPLTPQIAVLAIAVQPRAHQSSSLRAEGVVSGPTVFTAGLSGRIRCLNFADLQRSKVLSATGSESKTSYSFSPGVPAVTHETVVSSIPTDATNADGITSLAVVSSPVSSTVWLLSASLSGAIQAWKV